MACSTAQCSIASICTLAVSACLNGRCWCRHSLSFLQAMPSRVMPVKHLFLAVQVAVLSVAEQLRGCTVLLTGGVGFLGSVCLEQLLRLTEVRQVAVQLHMCSCAAHRDVACHSSVPASSLLSTTLGRPACACVLHRTPEQCAHQWQLGPQVECAPHRVTYPTCN